MTYDFDHQAPSCDLAYLSIAHAAKEFEIADEIESGREKVGEWIA